MDYYVLVVKRRRNYETRQVELTGDLRRDFCGMVTKNVSTYFLGYDQICGLVLDSTRLEEICSIAGDIGRELTDDEFLTYIENEGLRYTVVSEGMPYENVLEPSSNQ